MNTYTQLPLNLSHRTYRPELADVSMFRDEPTEPTAPTWTRRGAQCVICLCDMPNRTVDAMCDACRAIEVPALVQDGTYTIETPDSTSGPHFTFKVETLTRGNLAGKTIVSYLAGPDNDSDFVGFGFMDTATARISVWKRFAGGSLQNYTAPKIMEAFTSGNGESAGMAYAMRSGRCRRCNRTLTVPASLHRGYGPDCFGKL